MNYQNDKMDFRVRVNAQGLPGMVLYPVSKLFEFWTEGPLSDPVWRSAMAKGAEAPKSVPAIVPNTP